MSSLISAIFASWKWASFLSCTRTVANTAEAPFLRKCVISRFAVSEERSEFLASAFAMVDGMSPYWARRDNVSRDLLLVLVWGRFFRVDQFDNSCRERDDSVVYVDENSFSVVETVHNEGSFISFCFFSPDSDFVTELVAWNRLNSSSVLKGGIDTSLGWWLFPFLSARLQWLQIVAFVTVP